MLYLSIAQNVNMAVLVGVLDVVLELGSGRSLNLVEDNRSHSQVQLTILGNINRCLTRRNRNLVSAISTAYINGPTAELIAIVCLDIGRQRQLSGINRQLIILLLSFAQDADVTIAVGVLNGVLESLRFRIRSGFFLDTLNSQSNSNSTLKFIAELVFSNVATNGNISVRGILGDCELILQGATVLYLCAQRAQVKGITNAHLRPSARISNAGDFSFSCNRNRECIICKRCKRHAHDNHEHGS